MGTASYRSEYGPGINGNEDILHTPKISRTAGDAFKKMKRPSAKQKYKYVPCKILYIKYFSQENKEKDFEKQWFDNFAVIFTVKSKGQNIQPGL